MKIGIMAVSVFGLVLLTGASAQQVPVVSVYFQSIDFGIDKSEFVFINDGDREHESLTIKMPIQVSTKYQRQIVPGMFLIIQKDDPRIDLMNVLKIYMNYLSKNFHAVGKKVTDLPSKISGFEDQMRTEYQYSRDGMDFEGDLFVGRHQGFLFISWSTATNDFYDSTADLFVKILESKKLQLRDAR